MSKNYKKSPKPQSKKILVGLTGGINSTVALFLLKKQGYDCVGITLSLLEPNMTEKTNQNFTNSCHVKDLDSVKKICDFLDIPFYAVHSEQIFKSEVLDPLVGNALSGKGHIPCVYCQTLKIKILLEKADKLGIEKVATGHFAKINTDISANQHTLLIASDQKNDQSYMLSQLTNKELRRLEFPLAEMREEELVKLAQAFNLPIQDRTRSYPCFIDEEGRDKYIQSESAKSLRKSGKILSFMEQTPLGEHEGVHAFQRGQTGLKSLNPTEIIPSHYEVVAIDADRNTVFAEDPRLIEINEIKVSSLLFKYYINFTRPFNCYVQIGLFTKKMAAKIFLKNNNSGVITFQSPISKAHIGWDVVIYPSDKQGSKVMAHGFIESFGPFKRINRIEHLQEQQMDDDGNPIPIIKKEFSF